MRCVVGLRDHLGIKFHGGGIATAIRLRKRTVDCTLQRKKQKEEMMMVLQ